MRIDSSYTGSLMYGHFVQQGTRAPENRKTEEENELPSASTKKMAEKMKSVETTISTGTLASQETLTYSRALRAPTGTSTASMSHSDATDPGVKLPGMGIASAKEDVAPDGMPFAKTEEEIILSGQTDQSEATAADEPEIVLPGQVAKSEATAAGEAGKAEDTEESGTGKTGVAEKAPEDDPSYKNEISKLKQREQEVISHEAAHKAVGGQYTGGVSYTYTTGPDNKRYIDGGEVSISTPSTDDPHEALRMAEQVKMAALAPAEPSSQDRSVAASATQKASAARAEISKLAREEAAEKRAASQAEKAEKVEKGEETESGKTGAASSDKDDKKSSGIDLSNAALARGQKAADSYASLSNIHQTSSASGRLHAIG